MKTFNSLAEALQYHPKCPVCFSELEVNDDKHHTVYFDYQSYNHLCYELIDDDLVLINKDNDSIDFIVRNNLGISYDQSFCIIKPECKSIKGDCLFSYSILCYFDLKNNKLKNISLCAEQFSIENDNEKLCVINNLYDRDHTEYSVDVFSSAMLVEKLPLINLNFKNIKETLIKVEKMVLFI